LTLVEKKVLKYFKKRKYVSLALLKRHVKLPPPVLERVLESLVKKGFLEVIEIKSCESCPLVSFCPYKFSTMPRRIYKLKN